MCALVAAGWAGAALDALAAVTLPPTAARATAPLANIDVILIVVHAP
jgi:hypothetical protein